MNIVAGGARIRLGVDQRDQLTRFARYGLPLAIGGLSFALYNASDRLVVAYLSARRRPANSASPPTSRASSS